MHNSIKKRFWLSCIILFLLSGFKLSIAQTNKAVLSSRWFHPVSSGDDKSTLKVIKDLKPNRIDWTYCEDPNKLREYKNLNVKYSLAINPQIPDSGAFTTAKYRILDIFGKPYVASWMKGWSMKNPYWGCVNNPLFKKLFFDKTIEYANLGAYAIFVDDPLFNYQLQKEKKNQYGCFCKYCIDEYKKYKLNLHQSPEINVSNIANDIDIENITDEDLNVLRSYQKFQEVSVINFLKSWKTAVKKVKPDLLFLTNNFGGSWNDIYNVFDGGIGELQLKDLNIGHLDSLYKIADRLKKTQLFTLGSMNTEAQYYLLAYCKLKNREFIIPWDIFAPDRPKSSSRFYGNVDDIKKLFSQFENRSLKIEVSEKPFKKASEVSYYRIEDRSNYKSFILNRTPIIHQAKLRNRYKIAMVLGFSIITALIIFAMIKRRQKKAAFVKRRVNKNS